MDDRILDLLDSDDPGERLQGIERLKREPSLEALKYLSIMYKSDTDPRVREMAGQAGRFIKKQLDSAQQQGPAVAYRSGADQEAPRQSDVLPTFEDVHVSDMNRTRADSLLNLAMDQHVAGQKADAEKNLYKAFQINPNLRNDTFAVGYAGDILGVSGRDALDILSEAPGKRGGKGGKSKNDTPNDETSWGGAMLDLGIYGLVVAAVNFVGTLISVRLVTNWLNDFAISSGISEFGDENYEQLQSLILALSGLGVISALAGAITSGIIAVIWFFIYACFLHVAAGMILGGEGTLRGLIRRLSGFYAIITIISTIVSGVIAYFYIQSVGAVLEMMADAPANSTMMRLATTEQMMQFQTMSQLLSLASLIFFIFVLYWTSRIIGQNYSFGAGRGCLAQIIGIGLMVGLMCGCIAVFSSMLGTAFGSFLSGFSEGASALR